MSLSVELREIKIELTRDTTYNWYCDCVHKRLPRQGATRLFEVTVHGWTRTREPNKLRWLLGLLVRV